MNLPQNVLKMFTGSPYKQRDGDATDWWLRQQLNGPAFCVRLTVSCLIRQDWSPVCDTHNPLSVLKQTGFKPVNSAARGCVALRVYL